MVQTNETVDYGKLLYSRAASALKVNGILSIIFGAIGVVAGALLTVGVIVGTINDDSSAVAAFLFSCGIFIFWTLPHLYLIVSGLYLTKEPQPKVAKVLTIINLVIGLVWNLILFVFAIINLTQLADYERGYVARRQDVK